VPIADRAIWHSHPKRYYGVSDSYLFVANQQLRFDPLAINVCSVLTPSIDKQKTVVCLYECGVESAYQIAANPDAICSVPPDRVL